MNEIISNSFLDNNIFPRFQEKGEFPTRATPPHPNILHNWKNKGKTDILAERNHIFNAQGIPIPLIQSFNSEWIDTPSNSPSPRKNSPINMSSVATIIEEKSGHITLHAASGDSQETPKTNNHGSYITPISDLKRKAYVYSNGMSKHSSINDRELKKNPVSNFDIFWKMLNTIVGKDKMAKFGQYVLRLLIFHARQTERYLSDDLINIDAINGRFNDRNKKLRLFRNFIRHPRNFIRIITILCCSTFINRFSGFVSGLSMYRQLLRFGKTPFRVRNLSHKVLSVKQEKNSNRGLLAFKQEFLNRKTLGELIGLYYGINDEMLLLYKMKFLTNKSLRKVVARHELLAWYYDAILGLYNACDKLRQLNQEEMDLRIQIGVKAKAKALSKELLANNSMHNHYFMNYTDDNTDSKQLEEVSFNKTNAYIDLMKWLADFIFNSYNIFHLALPFATLQIWMGIMASSLSTMKLYRETRKKIQKHDTRP